MKKFILNFIKDRLSTIIFFVIVAIFALWAVISIDIARKNAIKEADDIYVPVAANIDKEKAYEYKTIAKSDILELYFDENRGAIQVKDLRNGYVWKGIADNDVYDLNSANNQWKAYMQSMFTITYNDLTKRDAPPYRIFANRDCDYLEYTYIPNGVSVYYGFSTYGIFITIEYLLDGDDFVVRIPKDGVTEDIDYAVNTIELLPFFGSAGNEVDGYLLYPDGSGGISRYEMAKERAASVKQGVYKTYSHNQIGVYNLFGSEVYERYAASLPVYGVKNNDNAFLAAFTKGAEDTGVTCYPSGYVINLNHIGFEVYMRNVYDVNMFNISTDAGSAVGKSMKRVDKEIINYDREIRFFMLTDEDANYSKMADTYRDYLIDNNLLTSAINPDDEMPLAVDVLMGVTETQMVFDKYITMTSFEQLQEIFGRLNDNGVKNVYALLMSWQKGGELYPQYWPPAGQIGGTGGMKDLSEYLDNLPNYNVFLENNFSLALQENGGFSTISDVVYNGLNLTVSEDDYTSTWFILNPQFAFDNSNDFLNKIDNYKNLGVGYEYLGHVVFNDYNTRNPFTKLQTIGKWQEIFQNSRRSNKKVATEGMNQYTFNQVDYLFRVQLSSFGLSITDNSVPFVQMVISGLIPYSAQAGNLTYDIDIQKLKWIEYGSLPYYRITYEDSGQLKNANGYSDMFTSTFNVWEDNILSVYNEFKNNFSIIYGQQMVKHEVLDRDLIYIEYANGVGIYINYNTVPKTTDGLEVPAVSYLIINGEG